MTSSVYLILVFGFSLAGKFNFYFKLLYNPGFF